VWDLGVSRNCGCNTHGDCSHTGPFGKAGASGSSAESTVFDTLFAGVWPSRARIACFFRHSKSLRASRFSAPVLCFFPDLSSGSSHKSFCSISGKSAFFFQRVVSVAGDVSPAVSHRPCFHRFLVAWCSWHLMRIQLLAEAHCFLRSSFCIRATAKAVSRRPLSVACQTVLSGEGPAKRR